MEDPRRVWDSKRHHIEITPPGLCNYIELASAMDYPAEQIDGHPGGTVAHVPRMA